VDDPAERVDKADGRNVESLHVFNIIDHSFANTLPTMCDSVAASFMLFLKMFGGRYPFIMVESLLNIKGNTRRSRVF
jgi:hypothetical protein